MLLNVYLTALIDFRINKVIASPLPFPVCLPLKHGSDRHETSPKRVSDDSRHFIFRRKFLSKLRTAVYPPRMAPIGLKLRENAFQVIPDISFFDGTNIFCDQIFCSKIFSSTVQKIVQQRACFGGAVQVYTPMSNAAREFIARTIGFSLLRPLAEG